MFSKQKEEKRISDLPTIIGEGTTVEGVLHIESNIRIDGKVFGEVKCQGDVTLGKEGYVENTITAQNLYIAGKVKGNVKIENKIHIYETGALDGTAEMKTIVIDENGYFRGESFMREESPFKQEKVVDFAKEQ